MYYKLGQVCVTNLQVLFYYNQGEALLQLGQVLLQIGAAITNYGNRCYKIGQLLQIGAKCITN